MKYHGVSDIYVKMFSIDSFLAHSSQRHLMIRPVKLALRYYASSDEGNHSSWHINALRRALIIWVLDC